MAIPAVVRESAPPRPWVLGRCIHQDSTPTMYPVAQPTYRVWLGIPDYTPACVTFDRYDKALAAMDGALFCGSQIVIVEWIDGRTWTQQVWVAEAAS